MIKTIADTTIIINTLERLKLNHGIPNTFSTIGASCSTLLTSFQAQYYLPCFQHALPIYGIFLTCFKLIFLGKGTYSKINNDNYVRYTKSHNNTNYLKISFKTECNDDGKRCTSQSSKGSNT